MARKLPLALKLTRECALQAGVRPFRKWSAKQKRDVRACVNSKMRRVSGR